MRTRRNFNRSLIFGVLIGLILFSFESLNAQARYKQPQPGEVYREYSRIMHPWTNDWRVTDPNVNHKWCIDPFVACDFLPNPQLPLTVDDLSGAIRAEATMIIWGGHLGTYGKKLRFNNNAWIDIPPLDVTNGIPAGQQGDLWMSQYMVTVDVPLSHLSAGTNYFQGSNNGQILDPEGWGQHGWYGMMIRIYYDPNSKSHPTGSVTSPSTGGTIGENPTVSASVSGSADRVDFLAYYDGWDTDGDGIYQEYHSDYNYAISESEMMIKNHVGTVWGAPWQTMWNTYWMPDQAAGGVKVIARIRGTNGVWYVTNEATGVNFVRSGSSVQFYKPEGMPKDFWVKEFQEYQSHTFTIPGGHNLGNASEAVMFARTWNGINGAAEAPNDVYQLKIDNWQAPAFGENHYYEYDIKSVPPGELHNGTNTVSAYCNSQHHGVEILYPGIGVMVRYGSAPTTSGPSIGTHPSNASVNVGQTATFTVGASGTSPLTYQWQKNGNDIQGANGTSYTTPATVLGDNGATFRCVVTNAYGTATSNSATLTVTGGVTSPGFASHPADQTVNVGQTATFTVVATGTAPLSYQWQKNTADIPGATGTAYTTPATVAADSGSSFRCVVTNAGGSATSNAAMLRVVKGTAPSIGTHPADQTVTVGQTATFTVTASGPAPLTYQWQKNSTDIPGATNPSYTTPATTLADSGALFRCIVTNAAGSATSNTARLIVSSVSGLQVTQSPLDQIVGVGQPATFTVWASGTAPLTYKWQKDGVDIAGATDTSYTTPATALTDSGKVFRCVVTNAGGSVNSAGGMLKVTNGSVSILPNSGFEQGTNSWSFFTNGNATFTVGAAGPNNPNAAHITIVQEGSNVQLNLQNVVLEAGARYKLFFRAYSTTGHDVSVSVQKNTTPFTLYGLSSQVFDLGTKWADYSVEFTASGFTAVVNDVRLMFWLAPYDANGDEYFFDDVVLAKVSSIAPPTIAPHPANVTVNEGQTATFTTGVAGTPPFTLQWQKNSVDIADANGLSYTTGATVPFDNGTTYRCVVKNAVGTATSNAALLTVVPGGSADRPRLLSPANQLVGTPTSVTLLWTRVPGATTYHLQLGPDSTFATGLVKNDSLIADTVRQVAGLSYNTTFYWRVRAKNGIVASPFSTIWMFKTAANLPAPVTLVSPANGASVITSTQRFTWRQASPNVTKYWFELGLDSSFTLRSIDSTLTDTTRVASQLLPSTTHWWRVRAANADGWGSFSEVRRVLWTFPNAVTPPQPSVPSSYVLEQNYPNPFNPGTQIAFSVPQETYVKLEVFTMLGNQIATLVDERVAAGRYSVYFDAGSVGGRAPLASGPYVYRLSAGGKVISRKMAFVK